MTRTHWHCLVVTLSLNGRQYNSKHLYLDPRNSGASTEMNWTEWRSLSKRIQFTEYLQCSEWDEISSCIYYTTLNVAQRRQRVSVRPSFDIYDFMFGLKNNTLSTVATKMQLGDISVFLDEPLKGWYFSNLNSVVGGAETSWLSIDTCKTFYSYDFP